MDPLRLTISFFESERDTVPRREDTTWGELRHRLLRFDLRDDKSGRAWSPVRFADGAIRGNDGVVCITVVVMDVDDGTDPQVVANKLGKLGYEYIIHSTFNSTPDHPKFRVIVPLANPCSATSWPMVFPRLCELLTDGHTDSGTKDPARLFFLPSAKPTGRTFTYSGHGRAVLAADLPELPPGVTTPAHRFEIGSDGRIPHGQRHAYLLSVASSIVSRTPGMNEAQALAIVKPAIYAATDDDQWPTRDRDIEAAVRSALGKYARPAKPLEPAPPLEEFDPEVGEVFAATDRNGNPDLGVAWVADGRLVRTTLSAELDRIEKKYAGATQSKSSRSNAEGAEVREREVKRLLSSLPFVRIRDALWPLPSDPTLVSVAEWERANGTLLSALERYFRERVVTCDPDGHLVDALWAMGASARSDDIDFAPRLMFEAPFGWGKSTAAEAVQLVVPRGVYGAALTPAAVYRMMNGWHPVLLVDESAIHDNPDFLRVLRTGFKRGPKIIRAAQNQDTGVVPVDPFGWVILTTQVDTKEDLVSRCLVQHLSPGTPEKRVTIRDPEATALRTVLTRLRLDILTGAEYPDIGTVAETARSRAGLEPRSRDKLTALWPFAKGYGVEDRLAVAAGRLEEEATEQLAGSDKGLVVAAIAEVVERADGLANLKASDLELRRIHEQVETLLMGEGEANPVPVFGGGTAMRVDLKRFGPRDFTARIIRELGFKVRTVKGRARIDRLPFLVLWPRVWSRYGGPVTLEHLAEKEGVPPYPPKDPSTPTLSGIPTSVEDSERDPYPTPTLGEGTPTLGGVGVGTKHPEVPYQAPTGPLEKASSEPEVLSNVRTLFRRAGAASLPVDWPFQRSELARTTGIPEAQYDGAVSHLLGSGELVLVSEGVFRLRDGST
jgi:hypothetical protein